MAQARRLFAIGLMFSLAMSRAAAESDASSTIVVLGTKLTLGMSKAAAFLPFSTYKLVCIGEATFPPECDSWIVGSNGLPYTPYANLTFSEGKLNGVWKYWERGFEGTEPEKFSATLHAVLSQYASTGETNMRVQTKEQRKDGITQRIILISKADRTVVISTTEGAKDGDGKPIPSFVNLYEILE